MKFWCALILVLCAVNRRYSVEGTETDKDTPPPPLGTTETDGGDTTTATSTTASSTEAEGGNTGTEENTTGAQEASKPIYFTDEWRALYSPEQLKNQAKWSLAEDQPEDGSFQTRIYANQWWASSHTPCQAEYLAAGNDYMNLYLYFNRINYQKIKYDLTYPFVFAVDSRPEPTTAPKTTPKKKTPPTNPPKKGKRKGGKRRRRKKPQKKPKVCPVKYTTYFYLPIPLTKWPPTTQDKSITTFKFPETKFYVREYAGNITNAYCEEQSKILALDLLKNNIWTWENYWHCAKYEAPIGQTEQKLEVWMKQRKE